MRLTVRTNLALRILMDCAVNAPRTLQAAQIARRCNASTHHVAQVVSRLAEAGLVDTQRGRGGGVGLAVDPKALRIGSLVRLFEAALPFTECMDALQNTCPLTHACRLRPAFCQALDSFYADLDRLTLHDLVDGNATLAGVLALPAEVEAGG